MSAPRSPAPAPDGDEIISTGSGLILPGGKVDPEAIQRAIEQSESGEDDAELRRVSFSLRRDLKSRLDRYLTTRIAFMSRNQLQKLIDGGGVTVNGRQPKASTVLRAGDVVEVVVPAPSTGVIRAEEIEIDVLFEDEHLIVLNKRPDIIVHPARSENSGTLVNALAWHFKHRSSMGGALSAVGNEFARPGVVHRLDRHTSGCIVFAKSEEAHWKLGHQFEHRRVDKRYLAVVQGHIEPLVDVIEAPIGPHPSREKGYREKYVVRHDELGKPSVTIARVRERYRLNDRVVGDQDFTLVELELKTGRTHQIRVHLSHTGYPIVGDDMYGGRAFFDRTGHTVIARQALHAAMLGFTHPITGQPMCFTSPMRGDMGELIASLRAGDRVESMETPGATVEIRI